MTFSGKANGLMLVMSLYLFYIVLLMWL